MGIRVSYIQVSESSFMKIKERVLSNEKIDLINYKIDEFYIENSFWGLKFVLIKGLGDKLDNIFGGGDYLCKIDFESEEYKKLSSDKKFEIFETTSQESYLDANRIVELSELIKNVSEDHLSKWYNPEELNRNKVYPEIWNQNEDDSRVYNLTNIKKCYAEWKEFLLKVAENKTDYIIVR